jgi:hypothetical protein
VITLQSENEAGENADDQDNRKANGSLLVNGSQDPAGEPFGIGDGTKRPAGKQRKIAESRNNRQSLSADQMKHHEG